MTKVLFKRWKGPAYEKRCIEGLNILVLGESHYGDNGEEYKDCTSDIVRE